MAQTVSETRQPLFTPPTIQTQWANPAMPGAEPEFDWLTGGIPRGQFDRLIEQLMAGSAKTPYTMYDPLKDFDKIEHAEVQQQMAKTHGAPAAFGAGVGQEAAGLMLKGIPDFITALLQNPASMKSFLPGQAPDPALTSALFGPQGFNIDDLIANMRGIQMAGSKQSPKQFLVGGK